MARISFDNGASFLETDDLSIYRDLINLSWNFIEVYMNDSIRAEDDLILP